MDLETEWEAIDSSQETNDSDELFYEAGRDVRVENVGRLLGEVLPTETRRRVLTMPEALAEGLDAIDQNRADRHFSLDDELAGSIPWREKHGMPSDVRTALIMSLPSPDRPPREEGRTEMPDWAQDMEQTTRGMITSGRDWRGPIGGMVATLNDYDRQMGGEGGLTTEEFLEAYGTDPEGIEKLREMVGRSVSPYHLFQSEHIVRNSAGGRGQLHVSAPHHLHRHLSRLQLAEETMDRLDGEAQRVREQMQTMDHEDEELGQRLRTIERALEMAKWGYAVNAQAVTVLQGNVALRHAFSNMAIKNQRESVIGDFAAALSIEDERQSDASVELAALREKMRNTEGLDADGLVESLTPEELQAGLASVEKKLESERDKTAWGRLTQEDRQAIAGLCLRVSAREEGDRHYGEGVELFPNEKQAVDALQAAISEEGPGQSQDQLYGLHPGKEVANDTMYRPGLPLAMRGLGVKAYSGSRLEQLAAVLSRPFDRLVMPGAPERWRGLSDEELQEVASNPSEIDRIYGSMTMAERREAEIVNEMTNTYLKQVLMRFENDPDYEEIRLRHIHGGEELVRHPEALEGVRRSADEIRDAILTGRKVAVLFDCDTDGTSGGSAALIELESKTGRKPDYVAQGKEFGHSFLTKDLVSLAAKGNEVIWAVDTGSGKKDIAAMEQLFKWLDGDRSWDLYMKIYGKDLTGRQAHRVAKTMSGEWTANPRELQKLPGYEDFFEGSPPEDIRFVITDHHDPCQEVVEFIRDHRERISISSPAWVRQKDEEAYLAAVREANGDPDKLARINKEFACYDQDLAGSMVVWKVIDAIDRGFEARGVKSKFAALDQRLEEQIGARLSVSIEALRAAASGEGSIVPIRELLYNELNPVSVDAAVEEIISQVLSPEEALFYRKYERKVNELGLYSVDREEKHAEHTRIAGAIARRLEELVCVHDTEESPHSVDFSKLVERGDLRWLDKALSTRIYRHYRRYGGPSETEVESAGVRDSESFLEANSLGDPKVWKNLAKRRAGGFVKQAIKELVEDGVITPEEAVFYGMYDRGMAINSKKQALAFAAIAQIADMCSVLDPEARQLVRQGLNVIQDERYVWEKGGDGTDKRVNQMPGFYRWLVASAMGRQVNGLYIGSRYAAWNAAPMLNAMHRSLRREVIQDIIVPFLTHRGESEKTRRARGWLKKVRDQGFVLREKLVDSAVKKVERKSLAEQGAIIVDINELGPDDPLYGFTGLVATDLTNKYNIPALVWFKERVTGKIRMSGRLPGSGNISLAAIFQHLGAKYGEDKVSGGGHPEAAGVSISPDVFDAVKADLLAECSTYKRELSYGGPIELTDVVAGDGDIYSEKAVNGTNYWNVLDTIGGVIMPQILDPFGREVDPPVLLMRGATVDAISNEKQKDGQPYVCVTLSDRNGHKKTLRLFEKQEMWEDVCVGDVLGIELETRIIKRNRPWRMATAKRRRPEHEGYVVANTIYGPSSQPKTYVTNIVSNSRTDSP